MFIGRKNELERLDRFARSPQSRIAVMYGRREMKYSANTVGVEVIASIKRKVIEARDFLKGID